MFKKKISDWYARSKEKSEKFFSSFRKRALPFLFAGTMALSTPANSSEQTDYSSQFDPKKNELVLKDTSRAYVVKSGDCLWSVAEDYLKDSKEPTNKEVLAETNKYELHLQDPGQLEGLSEGVVEAARQLAEW